MIGRGAPRPGRRRHVGGLRVISLRRGAATALAS